MKKNYILLFIFSITSLLVNAQDITYDFDSDAEGWIKIASATTVISQSNGTLVVGGDVNNYGGITSPDLNINEVDYDYVELVIQNNTSITGFQLMNYVSGGLVGGTAAKTNFDIPTDGAYHTILVVIPSTPAANNGVITNLGIRIKGNPAVGDSFVFDSITIKEAATSTYTGFVENPNFDDVDGLLGAWNLIGTGVTVGVSTDATSGSQAAEFTFSANIPTNPPTLFNGYRWSMDPGAIGNVESLVLTWDMKYSDNPNDVVVKIAPRWKLNIASGGTGDRTTYGAAKTATDTYATYTVTKTLSNNCAGQTTPNEGTNCFDTETYDNIELGMSARDGAAGVKLTIDNIITTITGTSLGIENINAKDDINITVYPNPSTEVITIDSPLIIKGIKAVNLLGQVMIVQNGYSNTLNVSGLKAGIYILKINQENGVISTKRFIKK
tara:strand:+ start:2604 stop:3923 length:1320 start_codon:yes stop_codon:yes gene_type:complete